MSSVGTPDTSKWRHQSPENLRRKIRDMESYFENHHEIYKPKSVEIYCGEKYEEAQEKRVYKKIERKEESYSNK